MEGPSAQASSPQSVGPKHIISNDGPATAAATTNTRNDDVGLVVTRAKKAAASLWMLIHAEVSDSLTHNLCGTSCAIFLLFLRLLPFDSLHKTFLPLTSILAATNFGPNSETCSPPLFNLPTAHQNCTKSSDQCPHHVSCGETKKLLAHVRSCASSPGFGCPDGVRGCDDAKKLLAHYRRCREIRARQAVGKQLDRQGVVRKEHNCLVCTFLARHATTMLDKALAITSDNITPNNNTVNKHTSTKTLPRENSLSRASMLVNTLREASRQRSDSCPEKNTTNLSSTPVDNNSIKSAPSSRQRSASCSILLNKSSSHLTCGGCDTIAEEEDNESSAESLQGVAEVR